MNKDFLYEMLKTPSVSGQEEDLQRKVAAYISEFTDEVKTDEIGDVIGVLNKDSSFKVLIAAHADEIGLMVTHITEKGMLKVTKVGGIYTEAFLCQKVRVMTKKGTIYGSVQATRSIMKKKDLTTLDLTIDIGAESEEDAAQYVELGDRIVFDTDYRELLNDRLSARALDDRIGVFVIMEALKKAKESGCKAGIYCASTVGEETSRHGASWVSSRVKPALGIAVDVTYTTDYNGVDEAEYGKIELEKGPVLCINPISHPKINGLLKQAAERQQIPLQIELSASGTGTDGDHIHVTNDGVPVGLVSIPLRYMHTPGEVVSFKDVQMCIDLLAEFMCMLDEKLDLSVI